MASDFRRLFNLPPALLYKRDLFELEKIFQDFSSDNIEKNGLEIRLAYKDAVLTANSIEGLFGLKDLPNSSEKLDIRYQKWVKRNDRGEIEGGISLIMNYNYISCQVYSDNQDWFGGKITRLESFFLEKKPWYSWFTVAAPWLLSVIFGLLFQFAVFSLVAKRFLIAIFSFSLSLLMLATTYFTFKQRLFPYVKIVLRDKDETKFDWNILAAIVTTFASLFILIDYIQKFVSFMRKLWE